MSFLEEVAVSDLETESSRIAPAAGVASCGPLQANH